jgi:hypothetical protein
LLRTERLASVRCTVWFDFLGLAFVLDLARSGLSVSTISTWMTSPTFKAATDFHLMCTSFASYGVGPKKMTQHYAYIGVQNSHINLGFYHGATLRDPDGLLEGSGKKLRHVKVRDVAATKTTALAALLRQAIADRSRLATRA